MITQYRLWRITLVIMALILSTILIFLFLNRTHYVQDPVQILLQNQQATLIANETSIQTPWLKTLNPLVQETEGTLVWNTTRQQGVMSFINLPTPKKGEHYHVWLYDLQRNQQDPISGGTFITAGEKNTEYWVAITPQAEVIQPYKFIVLLEDNHAADAQIEDQQILLLAQP